MGAEVGALGVDVDSVRWRDFRFAARDLRCIKGFFNHFTIPRFIALVCLRSFYIEAALDKVISFRADKEYQIAQGIHQNKTRHLPRYLPTYLWIESEFFVHFSCVVN